MKSYSTFFSVSSLALAAVFTVGSSQSALAGSKTQTTESFRLQGVIVDIDRDARTLTIKKQGENTHTLVRVPEGKMVRMSHFGNSANMPLVVEFEHVQRGNHVDLPVKSTNQAS
jgi:hypothetical protein